MTWLVLAHAHDEVARWVAAGLEGVGHEQVLFVTDGDLAGAGWEHRIGADDPEVSIRLRDGREIDGRQVRATVNRFAHIPPVLIERVAHADRDYAWQELSAVFVSWITGLRGPVLNPPDVRGLAGPWRPPSEWLHLATSAGLETAPLEYDSARGGWLGGDDGGAAWREDDVLVVGQAVFSERGLSAQSIEGSRRLAALANTPILGITLAADGTERVTGATPLPDLRPGGRDLIDALAEALLESEVSS